MYYKVIKKCVLEQDTTIKGTLIKKGSTLYRLQNLSNPSSTFLASKDMIKEALRRNDFIEGLKLDAMGRLIEDNKPNYQNVLQSAYAQITGKLNSMPILALTPSCYNVEDAEDKGDDIFDEKINKILEPLKKFKEYDPLEIVDFIEENSTHQRKYGLYIDAPYPYGEYEAVYTNTFETNHEDYALECIVKAAKLLKYIYSNEYMTKHVTDVIDNPCMYYLCGKCHIPYTRSRLGDHAYRQAVDFVYTDCCYNKSGITPDMQKYIEEYLKKYWSLDDEILKCRRSVEAALEFNNGIKNILETSNNFSGLDGYINPKNYIGDIIREARRCGDIYVRCHGCDHAALISLIAKEDKKYMKYSGIHRIKLKRFGIEVFFDYEVNTDGDHGTVVHYIGKY